jgi:hypothetical protein
LTDEHCPPEHVTHFALRLASLEGVKDKPTMMINPRRIPTTLFHIFGLLINRQIQPNLTLARSEASGQAKAVLLGPAAVHSDRYLKTAELLVRLREPSFFSQDVKQFQAIRLIGP